MVIARRPTRDEPLPRPMLTKLADGIWFEEITWRRYQMETFSALLAICAGNSPVPGEFTTQRPVTRSFDVFFDLRLNKRLSKKNRKDGDLRRYHAHYDVIVMNPHKTLDSNYWSFGCKYWYICILWIALIYEFSRVQNCGFVAIQELQFVIRDGRFTALRPEQNGCQFLDEIFNTISWKRIYSFWLTVHWICFPRVQLMISGHLFW